MRNFLFSLVAVLCLLPFTGCMEKRDTKVLPIITLEELSSERVWKRISEESNFRNYPYWPEHEGEHPGQAPHGNFHTIFINPRLRQALPLKDKVAPDGSIIVKSNCDIDMENEVLTIMVKVKGFDPEHGDWYWIKSSPEGKVAAEGKVGGCINCHSVVKGNDYLFVHPLDKELN